MLGLSKARLEQPGIVKNVPGGSESALRSLQPSPSQGSHSCSLASPALSRALERLDLLPVPLLQQLQVMRSCRSSSRRQRRRRTMRKLFGKLGTGTTGRTHTPGATATGTTWADALAASRAWRSGRTTCRGRRGSNVHRWSIQEFPGRTGDRMAGGHVPPCFGSHSMSDWGHWACLGGAPEL